MAVRLSDILWWHFSSLAQSHRDDTVFYWGVFVSISYDHLRFLLSIPFVAALVNSASKAAFGEPDSILSSMRVSVAQLGRYSLIGIIKLLAALILPELLAVGVFYGMAYAGDAAGVFKVGSNAPYIIVITVPLAVLVMLIGWLGAGFSLAFPAAVLEGITGFQAIRRSWVLSRNSRGRIVTVYFLILIFVWIVMIGAQALLRMALILIYMGLNLGPLWGHDYMAGVYVLNTIVIALLSSLYPIAATLIYYDQRIRREGYDIEKMMEAAGWAEAGTPGGKAAAIEAKPQETEA